MPLLLHLSDVHLGRAPLAEVADDYKDEFVPVNERVQRHKLLGLSLEALPDVLDAPLDVVVVSGDVTVANREDGFEAFKDLLGRLGGACPPPNRIVVVPGNHDVTWRTPPSSAERYRLFLKHVREAGYVTPLLMGVDIDAEGKFIGDPSWDHVVKDPDAGWVILPINSANYSGSTEQLKAMSEEEWEAVVAWLSDNAGGKAVADLQRLRTYDAARVAPGELEALRTLLATVDAEAGDGGLPLRIGVIHHHLLPVSPREEVKSYESITNLGLVRNFLRENRLNVVLHGHKHREYVYRDHIYPPEGLPAGDPHEVLVVAGATIGTRDWDESNVARLIRVDAARTAPSLAIASIPAKDPGGNLEAPSYAVIPLWRRTDLSIRPGLPQIVLARTFEEAYARVRSLFAETNELTNVICSVSDPATAEILPDAYPEIPDVADPARQEWFEDIVGWWQKTDSRLRERLHFTHGGRIVRGAHDQIEDAAEALTKDPETTRAVVTLLDPSLDRVKIIEHKYPAFCLVQLLGRKEGPKVLVDCVGYFRKQQMRYWWPVNVGELRHIQKLALSHLGGGKGKFEAGALWTITALAVEGNTIPRVAVPTIDRIFDEDENLLWSMAYAVAWDGMSDRATRAEQLMRILDELVPEEDFDPDGVPVALEGLSYLEGALDRLAEHHPSSQAKPLAQIVGDLYRANSEYKNETAAKVTTAAHKKWRTRADDLVGKARGVLEPLTNGSEA